MEDIGFNGSGSRFNSRFEAGSPITAKQLNNLADGIQASLPIPYLGGGVSVSFTPGGSIITGINSTNNDANKYKHQFDVSVRKKYIGEGEEDFIWLLSQVKGVCNYTWSHFPYYDGETTSYGYNGNPEGLPVYQNQCRIIDWAIYGDGDRTEGEDGASDFMADDGTIQIYNAANGGSDQWFVSISKLDWWDKEGVWAMARIIDAERPFVSVYEASGPVNSQLEADTTNTVMQHFIFAQYGLDPYTSTPIYNENGYYVPYRVGWTNKKIASLDWNEESKSWDVTQYLNGPIYLNIPYQETAKMSASFSPQGWYPLNYTGQPNGFPTFSAFLSNYTWLQTWDTALSGYVYNPAKWWYDIIQ